MMSLPKSWLVGWFASLSSALTSASVLKMYTPIDASARSGEPGMGIGSPGFSWNPVTRSRSSMATTPKRDASATGTSMTASVAAAPRSMWKCSMRA